MSFPMSNLKLARLLISRSAEGTQLAHPNLRLRNYPNTCHVQTAPFNFHILVISLMTRHFAVKQLIAHRKLSL